MSAPIRRRSIEPPVSRRWRKVLRLHFSAASPPSLMRPYAVPGLTSFSPRCQRKKWPSWTGWRVSIITMARATGTRSALSPTQNMRRSSGSPTPARPASVTALNRLVACVPSITASVSPAQAGLARHGLGQHSARPGEAKGPVARRPRRRSGLREPRPSTPDANQMSRADQIRLAASAASSSASSGAEPEMLAVLTRIAEALERAAPPATRTTEFAAADAFVWRADGLALTAVAKVSRVEMALLRGIDRVRDLLFEN